MTALRNRTLKILPQEADLLHKRLLSVEDIHKGDSFVDKTICGNMLDILDAFTLRCCFSLLRQ
ncbi:MAG: hypothetical protein NC038_02420 [Paludibacter sp.]|nr:hypothetical protein [Bacteroidales bacterium]MCM1068530.1 hypothetical protein [Prevotella sp.]MCM1353484.1 hypothetical protein [Bacteroides sp.]MCM1442645.1 hypothetical protein [Muribaculum sp.]MCM1481490.1 hypothetical protein [Paludibacter sp.]